MANDQRPAWLLAWRGLLWTHARVLRELERELLEQHDLPLTWFDVITRLEVAQGQRLRMQDLAEASLFTRSGLTRLVDRMAAAGLVRREASPEDRRGTYVALTPEGALKLDESWPVHEEGIRRLFGRHLDETDIEAVRRAMAKVLAPHGLDVEATGLRAAEFSVG